MKLFSNLLGMAAAGVLGYLAEPHLRFQLTGMQPSAVEVARDTKVLLQMQPDGKPIDLASLTPAQLPLRVLLKADVKVSDPASGVTMILSAGNKVKLLRIEAGNAVVSPGDGPFLGLTPVTETDLFQQIAANPPAGAPPITPAVIPTESTVPPPIAAVTPPTGDSEEPVKMIDPPKVPEPAPSPEITPEQAPASAPETAPVQPATAVAGPEDVVKAMQESIKTAQIKEFTFPQVLEWKADANETSEGETYQTGLASYKAETIFGVKSIQAKALIKSGKVVRWVWPKSGMEIK